MSNAPLAYRKDIEGLRAVAVLPVVAYHVALSLAPGGFVGVDVFFVISGYLITQLLQTEIDSERFSLASFYERRIRRIIPALLATLMVSFGLGLYHCLPDELIDLSKSLIAACLSVSNFYFWSTSGYFDGDSAAKPLLHTWSLAVEEQFYVFWPLYLVAARRFFRNRVLLVTLGVAALSLAVSSVGAVRFPTATFYLPFTRMWELAAGGVLALGLARPITGIAARNALAAVGLALIVASVFLINSAIPFPGLAALPPCLGTVLLIWSGRDGPTLVGRLLSIRPVSFVGAISYSLYLWHWPVTVFQKNYAFMGDSLSPGLNKVLILGVSFLAAVLSWRFIEQPFRSGRWRPSSRALVRMAATATVLLMTLGITTAAQGGFPSRFSADELQMVVRLNLVTNKSWQANRCFLFDTRVEWQLAPDCLTLAPDQKNYLLLGDSHAAELWTGFTAEFTDIHFLQASAANCLPTIVHLIAESPKCAVVLDDVMRNFLTHNRVDNVILVARWRDGALEDLAATLDWMERQHIRVTVIGPTVMYDAPVPRLVIRAMRSADPPLVQRHALDAQRQVDDKMERLAVAHHVDYISLLALECSTYPCNADNPWPEIFDGEHFNIAGSKHIARQVRQAHPSFER